MIDRLARGPDKDVHVPSVVGPKYPSCLLYTSDAADDMQCVDLGGRRIGLVGPYTTPPIVNY